METLPKRKQTSATTTSTETRLRLVLTGTFFNTAQAKIQVKGRHNVYVSESAIKREGGTERPKRTDARHTMRATASEISGSGGGDGAATSDPQRASSHWPSRPRKGETRQGDLLHSSHWCSDAHTHGLGQTRLREGRSGTSRNSQLSSWLLV